MALDVYAVQSILALSSFQLSCYRVYIPRMIVVMMQSTESMTSDVDAREHE